MIFDFQSAWYLIIINFPHRLNGLLFYQQFAPPFSAFNRAIGLRNDPFFDVVIIFEEFDDLEGNTPITNPIVK
jgi:hypothetical protein